MTHCFEIIRDKLEPPELLRPLFYSSDITTNVISEFFVENINFETDTIDSFIKKLSSNIDVIYQKTLDKIFESYQRENSNRILPSIAPAGYFDAINFLNTNDNFKLQVSLLVSNFNYAISLFTSLLTEVYKHIDALHNKYQKEIDITYSRIQSEVNLDLYENRLNFNIENVNDAIVSISLLHQYIFLINSNKNNISTLLAGYKHEDTLGDTDELEAISLFDFLIACRNELRLNILYAISKSGEMTLSQLLKLLGTSPPTMLRHIDVLFNTKLIKISRREGLQIFYKVNAKLFKNVQHSIDEFINRMQTSEINLIKDE